MASVGQVPSTITKVGFSLSSPLVKYLRFPIDFRKLKGFYCFADRESFTIFSVVYAR
jgi:hypothetical protein